MYGGGYHGSIQVFFFFFFCLLWHGLDLFHILRSRKNKKWKFSIYHPPLLLHHRMRPLKSISCCPFFIGKIATSQDENTKARPLLPFGKSRPTAIMEWTSEHVKDWLCENGLGDCTTCDSFAGKHIKKLYLRYQDNPREFETEMKSDYKMLGPKYLLFTVALEELFETKWSGVI